MFFSHRRQHPAPCPRASRDSFLPQPSRNSRNIPLTGHSPTAATTPTKRSHHKRNKPTQNPSRAFPSHLSPFSRNFFLTKRSHRSLFKFSSLQVSPLHSPPSAQRPFLV